MLVTTVFVVISTFSRALTRGTSAVAPAVGTNRRSKGGNCTRRKEEGGQLHKEETLVGNSECPSRLLKIKRIRIRISAGGRGKGWSSFR